VRRLFAATAATLALLPGAAQAHLASTGLGPVYDGVWHFVLTPGEVLPLALLALLAGRRGPAHARLIFFVVPPVWLAACLAIGPAAADVPAPVSASALLVAGLLLAADVPLPAWLTGVGAIVLASLFGAAYGTPAGTGGQAVIAAVGAAAFLCALLALIASIALPLRSMPAVTAVRVAGSWSAALGLLLAGWWIHARA
jgi:hypothetical protein